MATMIVVLIVAVRIQNRRTAARNLALAEAAKQEAEERRREAEEKIRPYQEAWAAARGSENLAVLVQCGDYLIKAAQNWQPHTLESVAWDVYNEFLSRLKTTPKLKPAALAMGRAAYAARRPDRALTIYDEQAIQNDILAHTE